MFGIMNAVIRTATRTLPEAETEYHQEARLRWPGRVALERTRDEVDRQMHLRGGLW